LTKGSINAIDGLLVVWVVAWLAGWLSLDFLIYPFDGQKYSCDGVLI